MELLAYWQIIRKRLLLILVLAILATLTTGIVITQQPPTYRTSTTLFLNPGATNPLLPLQVTPSIQATANTYAELMRTRAFAAMVAERSGLALGEQDVLRALTTQYVQDTQFFRITATHPDPNAAQVIAQTASETLIAQNVWIVQLLLLLWLWSEWAQQAN
ncbi:MAG: Wzz/FepE/Etk N-terminal domain-containing protein [Oscillochloridaceae bacterium umkhey_bin13]